MIGSILRFSSIYVWFSGGRDSAVSAVIAKRIAERLNKDFFLVHINTTIGSKETEEYVKVFSDWIGAKLIVLRPKKDFLEYVKSYPYWPSIYPPQYRWCYYHLKREPLIEFLLKDRNARSGIHVLGVRKYESLFREKEYNKTFFVKCYDNKVCIKVWLPLLNVNETTLNKLIRKFNIPINPVWRLGVSGECFCLAGTSEKVLRNVLLNLPDVREKLLMVDEEIQKHRSRSKEPSYPFPLLRYKLTLTEYWERLQKQSLLDDFMEYEGKACQGSCLLW